MSKPVRITKTQEKRLKNTLALYDVITVKIQCSSCPAKLESWGEPIDLAESGTELGWKVNILHQVKCPKCAKSRIKSGVKILNSLKRPKT